MAETENKSILVDPDSVGAEEAATIKFNAMQDDAKKKLASWVMTKVTSWEQWRDQNYLSKWKEYYRLWRGIWAEEDKTRSSERSRIISPALQQAIESAVAEHEEAVFGKKNWFDLEDDIMDQDKQDVEELRNKLLEDFEFNNVPSAISEIFLLAAVYGTGIGKILVDENERKHIVSRQDVNTQTTVDGVESHDTIACTLEPISPENFAIDPAVTKHGTSGINQALGVAHVIVKPKYQVVDKQKSGVYFNIDVGGLPTEGLGIEANDDPDGTNDKTKITEYYGLVPKKLLDAINGKIEVMLEADEYEEAFVEAIVTVANNTHLLRAVENEYIMKDRPFVAYPFDIVPGKFHGRGIAEKGYNAQKTLDAMLRAQLDGLALSVHPMTASDVTRMPRGSNMKVAPGNNINTIGNPNEILMQFKMASIDPMSYNATSDMERFIQMATGSMDSASPLRSNRRNETMGGMSMIMGGVMKRSKRALQSIERNFIVPMINKMAWRYMQFYPDRYKATDFKFKINGTLGMMAREMEQQQLTQLLGYVPPQSQAFFALLFGIIENSSISHKEEIKAVIVQSMQPDPQQQQMQQMLMQQQMEREEVNTEEVKARTRNKEAKTQETMMKLKRNTDKDILEMATPYERKDRRAR